MTARRFVIGSRHFAGNRSPASGKTLHRLAGGLCLAAAPTFMLMALVSHFSNGSAEMLCGAMSDASPFSGMALMYALMGIFHLPSWLRRIPAGKAVSGRPDWIGGHSCAGLTGRSMQSLDF